MYAELLRRTAERLHPKAWDFVQLTRLDRPIGIYLLLWPTLAALLIAGQGSPELKHVLVFGLGVVLMRSAGCVINDFADRKFDGHVARTRNRPLATGRLRSKEAVVLFAALVLLSFGLVLLTNWQTIALSFGALLVASLYPFMKRYTHCPQVVLGAAYSWGILMAFTAETQAVPWVAWLLYGANLLWTVAYDTYYAMTDREDDLKIGVKSTAILFGRYDRAIILSLQLASLGCLWAAGFMLDLHWPFILGLVGALFCFAWEFYDTCDRAPERCFHAFLHNHWAGLLILLGVWFDYQLY